MNTLIVFVKNLIPGKVKTRIANVIGEERAIYLYQILLDRVKSIVENLSSDISVKVYYSEFIDIDDKWSGNVEFCLQKGSNLGQRMANAIESEMSGPNMKICLIGSDIENMTTGIIAKSFEILDTNDTVLGPAQDGGYYLIGMKKLHPGVFKGVNWGTGTVFDESVEAMKSENITHGVLPILKDVDEVDDIPEKMMDKIFNRFNS